MGTVTAYTKEYMDTLIDSMIESGAINGAGHLIMTRHDSTTFDAGSVIGTWTSSIAVSASGSPPASPYEGQGWYQTDTERFYMYDGAAWRYRGGLWLCTSATRPASPFTGLMIYETDTKLVYAYDGAAWKYLGGIVICTSGTRPGTPFAGLNIFETDTKRPMVYDGTAWRGVKSVRFYAAGTATAGFTAETTQATLVVPDQGCDGTLDLIASCRIDKSVTSDDARLLIKDGATTLAQGPVAYGSGGDQTVVIGSVAMTAGSGKTITSRAARASGTGNITTYNDGTATQNALRGVFIPT